MWECNRLGNWKAGDGDWLQAWQDSETEQHLLTSLFPSSLPDFILLPAPSRLPLALSWYFPENAHSWGSLRWLGSNTHPWACHWGQGKGMFQLVYRTSPPPPPDSSTTLTLPTWPSGCFWNPPACHPSRARLWSPMPRSLRPSLPMACCTLTAFRS